MGLVYVAYISQIGYSFHKYVRSIDTAYGRYFVQKIWLIYFCCGQARGTIVKISCIVGIYIRKYNFIAKRALSVTSISGNF